MAPVGTRSTDIRRLDRLFAVVAIVCAIAGACLLTPCFPLSFAMELWQYLKRRHPVTENRPGRKRLRAAYSLPGLRAAALATTLLLPVDGWAQAGLTLATVSLPDAPAPLFADENGSSEAPQASAPPVSALPGKSPETSDEVLKREERQRILGVVPNFNTVESSDSVPPLSPKQKFHLMYKSSVDPFVFVAGAFVAGVSQAENSNPGFGQGAEGYFKRFGASYLDTVDGNLWGNAILPVLFKEDPRYFRLGAGSFRRRFLYSASTTVWCRRDRGTWGPNYANVLGNFISGGISNAYYPAADRGIEQTFDGALTVTAEGVIGAEFVEFWPDISKHFFKKHFLAAQAAPSPGERAGPGAVASPPP